MQYPPEQSRADFGLPSQPPPITRPAIVVNFRRPWMIFLALVSVAILALLLALFWFFLHQIPLLMIALFLDGVFIFYGLLMMASIFRALFLHEPALIINRAGIQILTFLGAGRCFMSWPEIGTIAEDYSRNSRYFQIHPTRYFQIHPKNYQQYLSRLSIFKRIIIGYWTRWPNDDFPPFSVPVRNLDRPGVEIFQQLTQLYAWELDYYHVCLQVALEDIPR
jgi:hypothetical protein